MRYTGILPLFTILLLGGVLISDAYAYLDPGSGSVVIQALIGALVGVGITLKVYWAKIKYSISNKRNKINDE